MSCLFNSFSRLLSQDPQAIRNRICDYLEAGEPIMMASTTANRVELCPIDVGTTSTGLANRYKIGKALTGGSAKQKTILWKLTF